MVFTNEPPRATYPWLAMYWEISGIVLLVLKISVSAQMTLGRNRE